MIMNMIAAGANEDPVVTSSTTFASMGASMTAYVTMGGGDSNSKWTIKAIGYKVRSGSGTKQTPTVSVAAPTGSVANTNLTVVSNSYAGATRTIELTGTGTCTLTMSGTSYYSPFLAIVVTGPQAATITI